MRDTVQKLRSKYAGLLPSVTSIAQRFDALVLDSARAQMVFRKARLVGMAYSFEFTIAQPVKDPALALEILTVLTGLIRRSGGFGILEIRNRNPLTQQSIDRLILTISLKPD